MTSLRPLLGTYVGIDARHADPHVAATATGAAFDAIETVQRLMTAFDADSDIGRVNARAHLEPVAVHPWTAEVLRLSLALHHDSDGLFDCGIAPHLAGWDMLPADTIARPQSSVAHLSIDDDNRVRSAQPTRIDLGGIAKGYAADKAAEAALAAGASGVVVNAGGDLRIAGDAEEVIHVRHPSQPGQACEAGMLTDGAIATSGTYFSKRQHQSAWVSALVDPSSGQPVLDEASYSVIAPSCALADALTKVLALSRDPHHPCLRRHGAQALIIQPS
ncbi:MAG: hypothetical protein RL404_1910 [Pseudomonadota bacterium]